MLLFVCASAFLSLVFGSTDVAGKTFDAGGSVGAGSAALLAEYLNRTGSIIVLLTLMMLAVILSTQFSFGRMFASASRRVARPVRARRRLAPRLARRAPQGEGAPRGRSPSTRKKARHGRRPRQGAEARGAAPPPVKPIGRQRRAEAERRSAPRRRRRWSRKPRRRDAAPLLPEPEPAKAPAPRQHGAFTLPPPSLLDAAEGRAEDRRARADGLGAPARGEVPRVRRRGPGRADPSRSRSSRRSSSSPTPA